MRRDVFAVALMAVLGAGCTGEAAPDCPPGFSRCGGVCISTSDDAGNCGACGTECAAGQACVASQCRLDCRSGLHAAIEDRWGTAWDGLERPPATLTDADAACEAIGGRLPTATEAWRVSWPKTGDVGQSYQTNLLWTAVARDVAYQFTVQLSSAIVGGTAVTTPTAFRCVCPAATPDSFAGSACNGPPGAECFALSGANAGYNIDAEDRAPLSKGGAVRECAMARGALPDVFRYGEAIRGGLAGGSGAWLHTADDANHLGDHLVRWSGVSTGWAPAGNVAITAMSDPLPFRCLGTAIAPAANPGRPVGAFVGAGGKAADAANRASTAWAGAHQACWNAGGHLAYETELGALVQQGLPGGVAATWLITADQQGFDGVSVVAGTLSWTGVEPRFGYYNSAGVSWGSKNIPLAFRCVYYPLKAGYVPPTEADCKGGCAPFVLPGGSGATLWLDGADRDAASLAGAMTNCANAGGHLATERDLTEAIRAGLGSGSGALLHAADFGSGSLMLVKWSGTVGASYDDLYPTYMSWGPFAGTDLRPYRCVWTNELR